MSNSDPILCSLELTVDKALNDCSKRLKRLDGRDKKALQEEWWNSTASRTGTI